jgi:hypothetical protein
LRAVRVGSISCRNVCEYSSSTGSTLELRRQMRHAISPLASATLAKLCALRHSSRYLPLRTSPPSRSARCRRGKHPQPHFECLPTIDPRIECGVDDATQRPVHLGSQCGQRERQGGTNDGRRFHSVRDGRGFQSSGRSEA